METKTVEKDQIKIIHTLLSRIGRANEKEFKMELVQNYTGRRATSTTQLTYNEAAELIADLQRQVALTPDQIKANAKRRLILSYAHQMGWEKDNGSVDMERVNAWCEKYGQYHKPLNEHSVTELSHLIVQYERVYKGFLKSV